jgi:DNA-binding HxlR family transcriptional regulator
MDGPESPDDPGEDGPDVLRETQRTRADLDEDELDRLDAEVESVLSLLGRRHTLAIMHQFALEGGPWRFTELEERVDVPPHTLSERLSALTEADLLERHSYDEVPPRVEYTWTQAGRDLSPAFHEFYEWVVENRDVFEEPEE